METGVIIFVEHIDTSRLYTFEKQLQDGTFVLHDFQRHKHKNVSLKNFVQKYRTLSLDDFYVSDRFTRYKNGVIGTFSGKIDLIAKSQPSVTKFLNQLIDILNDEKFGDSKEEDEDIQAIKSFSINLFLNNYPYLDAFNFLFDQGIIYLCSEDEILRILDEMYD